MKSININSYAKVNIGLKILNKRSDGYHNISTVFQEIDLFDSITISKSDGPLKFSSNVEWLQNDQNNLCVIAYNYIKNIYKIGGANIVLKKNISRGSGLGSGSSNAAATMKGLREIYNLEVADSELIKIGSKIGADVPFFINGSTQVGEGIGEKLTSIRSLMDAQYLIVTPNIPIDTKWAYSQFKNNLDNCSSPAKFSDSFRGKTINLDTLKFFENDFESVVFPTYPEIGAIKNKLIALGAKFASLSGSGSTVYGIFDDDANIDKAFSHFFPRHKTFIAHPV
ncbi:4-(cytidine 5'-diphospho)-2-C-methyl-D-erythritol kinase [bacterium]|jgi:4-diphosphocytidyl-2-C-methyl-D-erythritol kinase|nr:4-(cytidine 5'-diphospho)-2-C-methyl-D-erythritol kinase [bacterium]MBT4249971.1 4-(cytidine 5'-diphospho)-2-C-methyl-D-erythritol kinase [bacterium]MBT6019063.1 4-(cytidine 5'-diphospho)-2-C-methyl-D-erythritol kinase [bacterium]